MKKDGGLRDLFRERLPAVHWQTIEVGLAGRGVPDANGCHAGVEFWVEYKRTTAWAVDIEPEQVGWALRRTRAGGRTFVAVRRRCLAGPRRPARDELWLVAGAHAAVLIRERGLRDCPVLGSWVGGPPRWDWAEVLRLLVGTPPHQSPGPATL